MMPKPSDKVLCVLSDEQAASYRADLERMRPAGAEFIIRSSADEALRMIAEDAPRAVIVGMMIDAMEGLEFVAVAMGQHRDYTGAFIILPDKGDPFPPVLQRRDPKTGRSLTENADLASLGEFLASLFADGSALFVDGSASGTPTDATNPRTVADAAVRAQHAAPGRAVGNPGLGAWGAGTPRAQPAASEAKSPGDRGRSPALPKGLFGREDRTAEDRTAGRAVADAPKAASSTASALVASALEANTPAVGVSVVHTVMTVPAPPSGEAPAVVEGRTAQPALPGSGVAPAAFSESLDLGGGPARRLKPLAKESMGFRPPAPAPSASSAKAPAAFSPPGSDEPIGGAEDRFDDAAPTGVPDVSTSADRAAPGVRPMGSAAGDSNALGFAATVPGMTAAELDAADRGAADHGAADPSAMDGAIDAAISAAVVPTATVAHGAAASATGLPVDPPQGSALESDGSPAVPSPQTSRPSRRAVVIAAGLLLALVLGALAVGSLASGEASVSTAQGGDDSSAAPSPPAAPGPADVSDGIDPDGIPAGSDDPGSDDPGAGEEVSDPGAPGSATGEPSAPLDRIDLSQPLTLPLRFARGRGTAVIDDARQLDQIIATAAAALASQPGARLEVGGHTSDEGTANLNRALGGRRARYARDLLLRRGLDGARVVVRSFGSSRPVGGGTSDAAANRRVSLSLVPAD